ncbi:hypothetical protein QBC43DRAFT_309933 [Cladorrhinum sp. PSN259]|nr:hypothetical protein QBC43DRAFT_309933 [Cladorrhinum sp. PSN259]
MMDRIFAGAEYVIVWLGEKADASDVAIKFAKLLSRAVYMWDYSTEGYTYSPVYLRPEANILLSPIFRPAWDAFYRLLNTRPWWYRAWVVQEITVARAAWVLCGNSAISWPDLERAISTYHHGYLTGTSRLISSSMTCPAEYHPPSFSRNFQQISGG